MARLRSQKNASAVTTGHNSSCTSSSLKKREKIVLGCCLLFLFYSYNMSFYANISETITKIKTMTMLPIQKNSSNNEITAYNNKKTEQQNGSSRITYRVVPGFRPDQQGEAWKCHLVDQKQHQHHPNGNDGRELLWPEMRHLFNFSTYIDFTDLRILFMGDSVGDNMAMFLEQMMIIDYDAAARGIGNKTNTTNNNNNASFISDEDMVESSLSTTIFRKCNGCGNAPGLHITAPLDDKKGAIAGWRMTGMFLRDAEGWAQPNWNRGWYREDVYTLRAAVHNATTTKVAAVVVNDVDNDSDFGQRKKSNNNNDDDDDAAAEGDFDVFVFRIPAAGWIPFSAVTNESLTETITLANELFGIRKVIFVTMHYNNNNNLDAQSHNDLLHTNELVREFAHRWTTKKNSNSNQHQRQNNNNDNNNTNSNSSRGGNGNGVDAVYVLENGRLNDAMMEFNAQIIGFNTSTLSYIQEAKLGNEKATHSLSVAHVCAERVKDKSTNCRRNSITADGMHLCMNIVGQRINAGLACIMQCAYDNEQQHHPQSTFDGNNDNGWACATSCNDRFMSLEHVVV